MIRIVNISKDDNVMLDVDCFALYDTVYDMFLSLDGIQVWSCIEDFEDDLFAASKGNRVMYDRISSVVNESWARGNKCLSRRANTWEAIDMTRRS